MRLIHVKNFSCPKCGSKNLYTEPKGTATGLYCGDCGRWIKWLGKEELRLFNQFLKGQKEVKRD